MNHVAPPAKTGQSSQITSQASTFPRGTKAPNKTKTPPSPSHDSKASFSADQSKSEDFTWDAFTPISQEVLESAFTRHNNFYRLSDRVLKQGTKMKSTVWDVAGKPGETMTYEQLLQGEYRPPGRVTFHEIHNLPTIIAILTFISMINTIAEKKIQFSAT